MNLVDCGLTDRLRADVGRLRELNRICAEPACDGCQHRKRKADDIEAVLAWWAELGTLLKSGGMDDPAFLVGMVQGMVHAERTHAGLTTDNPRVVACMGSVPECAANGCQFRKTAGYRPGEGPDYPPTGSSSNG